MVSYENGLRRKGKVAKGRERRSVFEYEGFHGPSQIFHYARVCTMSCQKQKAIGGAGKHLVSLSLSVS